MLAGAACAAQPVTLSGEWTGSWNDSRKEYSSSGGNFSGICAETEPGKFNCTFHISKDRCFKVILAGKPVGDEIVFNTSVSLGDFHGVYAFKGRVTRDDFSGEYEGPGERGTFTMKRKEP